MNSMNFKEVLKYLPQRYPFIFIDKVIFLEPKNKIIAIKNISLNEPYFSGHFPDNPIMPGVLILEALAQASIILAKKSVDNFDKDSLHVFAGIDKARFKKLVVPGDILELHVDFGKVKRDVWKMNGVAKVGDDIVCTADLMSASRKIDQ